MSWKVAVQVKGEPNWSYNAQRFATKEEAQMAGDDLFSRWTAVESYEPQESTDPVNYRLEAGQMTRVEPSEPSSPSPDAVVESFPNEPYVEPLPGPATLPEAAPEDVTAAMDTTSARKSKKKSRKSMAGKFVDGSSMKGLFDTKGIFPR